MSENKEIPTSLQDGVISSFSFPSEEEIEKAIKELAKESTAPDKETPDWMESDIRRGMMWVLNRLKNKQNVEPNKEFQKVVWDDPSSCCNYQDLYSHGNREWCKSCGHVFNYR